MSFNSRAAVFLLLGLSSFVFFRITGLITLAELLTLAFLPVVLIRNFRRLTASSGAWLLGFLLLWIASTLVTDLYIRTPMDRALRGIARPIGIMAAFVFFQALLDGKVRRSDLLAFYAGSFLSSLLELFVLKNGLQFEMRGKELSLTWESSYVTPVMLGMFAANLWLYQRRPILSCLGNVPIAFLHLFNGSRSAALIVLLGATVAFIYTDKQHLNLAFPRLPRRRILLASAAVMGAALLLAVSYSWLAENRYLGERAHQKYVAQSSTSVGIISGRGHFISSLLAIKDSPILGHGSWPLDQAGYYEQMCNYLGVAPDPLYYRKGFPIIPTHSMLFGSWVENGVCGALFWIAAIFFTVRFLFSDMRANSSIVLWGSTLSFYWMWHIMFTPIFTRLDVGLFLAVCASMHDAALRLSRVYPKTAASSGQLKIDFGFN